MLFVVNIPAVMAVLGVASTVVCCKVTFSDESSVGIINNAVCCNLPAVVTMLPVL